MSNAVGWCREDYEAAQAVNFSDGLHPVNLQNNQHYYQHDAPETTYRSDERYQAWQNSPAPPSISKGAPQASPVASSLEPKQETATVTPGTAPRILGLRRTTFFLTVSNILLAIALIVLGVVQSQILRKETGTTGPEAQGACPSPNPSATSTSTSTALLPTCTPEPNKICFATDQSITTAVAVGAVIKECPLPAGQANYTVPGTKLTFRRECETDYPSGDLGRFPVISMADCIHLCAQLNLYPASALGPCMGVSWVTADGPQGLGLSFCYPKSAMGEANPRAATESAVLLDG
ncbi:hypothetical protein B0I37DRAFT_134650 [Chaetomium sp. MPI-CAGE-AT-0009]|nr:hypothetical protein B0I37DRAFT_134650 [Chaetomium sp. MPI-CAGE-AT-0009]